MASEVTFQACNLDQLLHQTLKLMDSHLLLAVPDISTEPRSRGSSVKGLQCREYCNVDTFQADCGEHQVILMTSARYGRMQIGKCIQQDLGHMGCHVDVVAQMDTHCSGRKRCTIPNVDAALRDVKACSELVKYLDATYKCIPVMSVSKYQCQSSHAIFAPPPPSHLANIVTMDTGCGDQGHPWVIEVDVTKRINVTLVDFGRLDATSDLECIQYGSIKEPGRLGVAQICGGTSRMKPVYLSQGHRVEITLKSPNQIGQTHFLVEYKAVGCPSPVISDDMWLRQLNGHVTVGCHGDDSISWQVTCEGDNWIGHIGNCSTGGKSEDDVITAFLKSMPKDLLIYIVVGVAVLILLLLVIAVMACMRRFCPSNKSPNVNEPALRRGDQSLAMRTLQQQTSREPQQTTQPQQTTLTTNNIGQASPTILRQPMDDPWTRPSTLPYQLKKTPPKPTPRRTLARRQEGMLDERPEKQANKPASPSLPSPGTSWDDTCQKPPRRHSGRMKNEQAPNNETSGTTVRKASRPGSYRCYPSATMQSRGRPQPSAPQVEDIGFV